MSNRYEADYLIIGAGATAMAFADTLLTESDSTAIMVDRRHRPGGHWNDAYPFVRLHSPSAYYGVNSRPLGANRIDRSGLNEGLFELAAGGEICTYFDEVMRHQFLPTGRLRYLPMHDYRGDGAAVSLLSGETVRVAARKKIVDVTFVDTKVPSRTPPSFKLGAGIHVVPPNDLPQLAGAPARFVVIGAGKTAIDVVVWLLSNGADADRITWVRPRDAWQLSRATTQPDYAFFEQTFGAFAAGFEAAARAKTVDDIFLELEEGGYMRRIDPTVTPTMFRCAIVSEQELALLRHVKDVVRLGRVLAIEEGKIGLERGEVATPKGAVYVNCSACGIPRKPPQPIFQGRKIVPQYVRYCTPTFSAALAAKIELVLENDEEKNALCAPVPMPDKPADWPAMQLAHAANAAAWQKHDWLMRWMAAARLDQFTKMVVRAQTTADAAALKTLERYRAAIRPGLQKLTQMAASAG